MKKTLFNDLDKSIEGNIKDDLSSRFLYSTDASIYQLMPRAIAFPKNESDLQTIIEFSKTKKIPVIPRGAGTGLAGQVLGDALIIDYSRYLNHIIEINSHEKFAIVEPGVVINDLNKAVEKYGLQFGPDPASADRATIGGAVANNATGAHSIEYGMAVDHVLAIDTILSNGENAYFEEITNKEANLIRRTSHNSLSQIYKEIMRIRENYKQVIMQRWPRTWRRASGYNLNYLLPWSPSSPPMWGEYLGTNYPPISKDAINLASLLTGSEGTLAVFKRIKIRLIPKVDNKILIVLDFDNNIDACDAIEQILQTNPIAIELIPGSIVSLAKTVSHYSKLIYSINQLGLRIDGTVAWLAVEYADLTAKNLENITRELSKLAPICIAQTRKEQLEIWAIRKAGLGLLMSRIGTAKPFSFIEDVAVPVNRLGEYVRGMERIFQHYQVVGDFYAHASAGCLHIRPILNLKTKEGVELIRKIAEDVVRLTQKLDGTMSGEHGDGIARSEWLIRIFGEEVVKAFREIKTVFDPDNLFNPGKIVNPLSSEKEIYRMDEHLRFDYNITPKIWTPNLDFSKQGDLQLAIEQCNGSAECRKNEGIMCPSYQATKSEKYSTRGRANLLRALIYGKYPNYQYGEDEVHDSLDICLACKGCKTECPSGVDIAKLKYEFLDNYYSHHKRRLRDYLFAYIDIIAKYLHLFSRVVANGLEIKLIKVINHKFFGITKSRQFPRFSQNSFHSIYKKNEPNKFINKGDKDGEFVLFLVDPFTEYFHPDEGLKAIDLLKKIGLNVYVLKTIGTGRTLISKGFIDAAREHAKKLIKEIETIDPSGSYSIIGIEPSDIYTLKDEYLDLNLPGDIIGIANRTFMIDEYLIRPSGKGSGAQEPRLLRIVERHDAEADKKDVLVHGHCYQKAQNRSTDGFPVGMDATIEMLKLAGYKVNAIDSGCCGMAGAFGYEAEHYDLSMQIGELSLFPTIRESNRDVIICTSGVSCQAQIEDGTGREAIHPIMLL